MIALWLVFRYTVDIFPSKRGHIIFMSLTWQNERTVTK